MNNLQNITTFANVALSLIKIRRNNSHYFLYIFSNITEFMTNPFEAFNISDDEQTFQPATEQKMKRTHQQKKLYKQQQQATKTAPVQAPIVNDSIPERIRDNAKDVRDKRAPPTPYTKKLGDGHYHDRRSGTGRVDKPRKEGGGWGNVGNLKDQLNKQKYVKQAPEGGAPEAEKVVEGDKQAPIVEQKPEEPQALTLEEYYRNKGVEVANTYEKKTVTKKADLNAEWIKKEKLVVLQSKEDKKLSERNGQNVVKFSSARVGLDENLEILGLFERKAPKKHEEHHEKHDHRNKGKHQKNQIREEDFPTL